MSEAPHRACVFELKMGADSRDALIDALREIEFEIAAEMLTEGACGGYSAGYTYKLSVDESITHESYFVALDKYLAEKKNE